MSETDDVFDLPESDGDKPENRFRFRIPGDDTIYSVPLLKFVKPQLVIDLEKLTETQFMLTFIKDTLPDAWPKIKDTVQLEAMFKAWAAKSGIDLGESEPSQQQSGEQSGQSDTSSSNSASDSNGSAAHS